MSGVSDYISEKKISDQKNMIITTGKKFMEKKDLIKINLISSPFLIDASKIEGGASEDL